MHMVKSQGGSSVVLRVEHDGVKGVRYAAITKISLVIYTSVIPGTNGTQALVLASVSTYDLSDSSALLSFIFISRNELCE